jgi:signal transduction histidine kinase
MASKKNTPLPRIRRRTSTTAPASYAAADDLVTKFAHELRTPLSATLLWARLLNSPDSSDPVLLREGLEAIETSAKEQQVLIDQLVEVAHLLAGRIRLHRTAVALTGLKFSSHPEC